GIYNNVIIVPVVDELPDSVEFLGFVDSVTDDDPVGGTLTDGPIDIGGNLEALYDADEGIVRIQQKDGTRLDSANGPFNAYVAVNVTDASDRIVNAIDGVEAIIDPVPSVSVGDFVWVDEDRDGLQGDDEPGIP